MSKDIYLKKILGEECVSRIRNSKILMVGAGGIGCELLKDLVLTGYGEIHIVDLDTVTLSNLNRQFLFRQKDIDKSKSFTIASAVQSFNYLGVKLIPHHGNVMDTKQFPIEWWGQFNFIFNALDNLEARRYVNKMALFLRKPLMESGTTGYAGQIQPIYPYYSECFDCHPKETPKSFPVCTIRSTPSQPVHCITWAKEFLFRQLFDENDNSNSMNDANQIQNETDDKDELENLNKEANELIELRSKILLLDLNSFINELLKKIFKVDIERLLSIETLWKARKKPIPLDMTEYREALQQLLEQELSSSILTADTKVWTILENIYSLYKSSESIQKRLKSGNEPFITFDKDDEDTLIFVAAASNLRSFSFGIPLKSKFDIKEIAGNIIPAIATTNAIIAGFSSLSGTQFFQHQKDLTSSDFSNIFKRASSVFISIRPNKYITGDRLSKPAENCASDSLTARGVLTVALSDLAVLTLEGFIDRLAYKYGYSKEDISIQIGKSKLIYDVDFDDYLQTKLKDVPGVVNGEVMLIQDDADELENLELYLNIKDDTVELKLPILELRPKKMVPQPNYNEENNGEYAKELEGGTILLDDDDDELFGNEIEILDDEEEEDMKIVEPPVKKRKLD